MNRGRSSLTRDDGFPRGGRPGSGEDKEYVLKRAKELDVKFIRLWFTDILGVLKSVNITVEDLEDALEEGMSFDGAAIEGFARHEESDMVAMPDPTTFVLLPWRPRDRHAVARMFCDIQLPDGSPFEGDPRWVLRRTLQRAADLGYTYYVGPEIEFFYFQNSEGTPQVLDRGGYFDLTPLDMASDLRRETVLALEEMGIGVEYSHHEVAFSQHEIDLRYTDALTMADAMMTYRLVVKQVAMSQGVYATFMPKPLQGANGSGLHVHQSLVKGGQNAFFDPSDRAHLADVARHYVAGLLHHAPALTAITNQWVNSYKRLVPGYEAPTYLTWALKNRADLIRVPEYKVGHEDSRRIEYRAPDPACNPYLAFAAMLAAGLDGIEKKMEPPAPMEVNVFDLSEEERKRRGIGMLPASLDEALQLLEQSDLMRQTLGDHVFRSFIENKRAEWNDYRAQVTDYELKRYLPVL